MKELFFEGHAAWFTWPAFIGSAFFIVRMMMMLVGGAIDVDLHDGQTGLDVGHLDVDHVGADHPDSTEAFKFLSVQSILAFAMGFGWAGLGGLRGSGIENLGIVLLIAVAGGVAMVWLLTLLLKAVGDLQSSGNISIQSALGLEGTVYASVPGRGKGKGRVRLVIDDRQRMYSAVTEGDGIATNTRIRVTRINSDNTVTVAAV